MIYKVTLLKDTPTLKAGTMWKYYTENGKFDFSNQIDPDTLKVIYGGELMPREILDKPEWASDGVRRVTSDVKMEYACGHIRMLRKGR